jgi:DNA polymerase V
MCSRSFGTPVVDLPTLTEVVSQFATQVARKLREQGSVAGAVNVFINTSPFRRGDRQHAPSATLPLGRPSADTRMLASAAVQALRSIFKPGFNYVKAGVMLVELQQQAPQRSEMQRGEPAPLQATLDLFDPETPADAPQRSRAELMNTLDALNQRFGRNAVTVASAVRRAGPSTHASRQDRRSPRYTTRLDEIVTARA